MSSVSMSGTLEKRIGEDSAACEKTLASRFRDDPDLNDLLSSEQYSLFAGGKRIRPLLVIEACRLCGGEVALSYPFAAAIEMVHTYSLIHDDLPCMDNDALRRGKPTNHRVFGESTALLAGDGLLTDAFGVIASAEGIPGDARAEAVQVLSIAAGSYGMVGGQVMDLAAEETPAELPKLLRLHTRKTGALIGAAVHLGAIAAGHTGEDEVTRKLLCYAEKIGLAFQIRDDILDLTATEAQLGKSVGGDAEHGKTTFMTYYSPKEAEEQVVRLTEEAVDAIRDLPGHEVLADLATWLSGRDY